ncbi:MAG TPA: endonuclease/exonuclease/phosphatase family protein [Micromonosporaceae bacterium]|nr:endonuclease/exonuclease/phosphatase family protein [Micromonosporaceae bacterium]
MRRTYLSVAAIGLGILLLVDLLRVWLPSIITIFGQAASTPAELLGAFALLWFLLALGAPPLVRFVGPRPVALAAALVLAGGRVALAGTPGGQLQLYVASIGLLAGLVWLAATATATARPVPGLIIGLATATLVHTALDTYDLTWRGGAVPWVTIVAVALVFLIVSVLSLAPGPTDPHPGAAGSRAWLLFGPALLLAGLLTGAPALANVAVSYALAAWPDVGEPVRFGDLGPALVGSAAAALFVGTGLARPPRGRWRWSAPVALVLGVVVFATGWLAGLIPAVLLTAAGLGGCLSRAGLGSEAGRGAEGPTGGPPARVPQRRGFAAVGGMLVFAVTAVLYYAAYDLGYPNQWVPVAVAVLVAVTALGAPYPIDPVPHSGPDHSSRQHHRFTGTKVLPVRSVTAAAALLTLLAAVAVPQDAASPNRGEASGPLRLVAYNIRMGFGLDGRFDLDGLVDVLARQKPDVVALSEVDRAWLLNGGHDTLSLLAKRLNLSYLFAPAADPVWGDAVLVRLPVREARTVKLSEVGAPTGAQALAVVLAVDDREMVVVSTHLQPPPGDGPIVQAREVVRFATAFAAGRPLVVAGDMNTEPGEPAFQVFTGAGLVDALAAARPLPTSPADAPRQQIDHVFVSTDIQVSEAAAPRSTASDHLPVAVTLTLP